MHTGFWWGEVRAIDHLEDLCDRWEVNIKVDLQERG
jgi:hypothetical protein